MFQNSTNSLESRPVFLYVRGVEKLQLEIQNLLRSEFASILTKRPRFSLRQYAKRLNLPVSALSEIMNGKRPVSKKFAQRVFDVLGVPKKENLKLLSGEEFKVISNWWFFAILSLAETEDASSNPSWIAKRLGISASTARKAIQDLSKLGLVRIQEAKLIPTGEKLRVQSEVPLPAIQNNHREGLELAAFALTEVQLELREFGAMTFSIHPKRMPEFKKRIRSFRAELSDLFPDDPKSEVYRLQVQFFPLTKSLKIKGD